MAIFKSSSVKVRSKAKAINSFCGVVKHLYYGKRNVEIILDLGEEETLVSVMPLDENCLEIGSEAIATVNPKDVMIGR